MSHSLVPAASVDRSILRLALPALGALIAEPLLLLADSAMVGHLGTAPLAGLGVAGAVLQTVVGLMVFLAYATTPAVARRLGGGDLRGAVQAGVDGLWLALAAGIVLAVALLLTAPTLVAAFGASGAATADAATYLSISAAGLPAMLLVFAATGLLRGLQDTLTPLRVALGATVANVALNALLIYGLGLGIAGSALGTVIAQWGMVAAYAVVIDRHRRRAGASARPRRAGLGSSARSGGWLLLRTVSLRAAILLAVGAAAGFGDPELAAYQVAMTVFSTLAFTLDALAIAAQALIGRALGAGDLPTVDGVLRRCVTWGVGAGTVLGVIVALAAPLLPVVFTSSEAVRVLLVPALLLVGVAAPLAGFVFVLDGVLIGAGDARYLALTGLVNLAVFLPALAAVARWTPGGVEGMVALLVAFCGVYLGARATTLGLRSRGSRWRRTGVT